MATPSHSSQESNDESSPFVYSQEETIKATTKLIITEGFPLSSGEHPNFVRFVTKTMNPNFKKIDRRTLLQEAEKQFLDLKKELHATIDSLPHKISLIFDVWRNANCLNFIRVTAIWIDSDWLMQRRVLSFRIPDVPLYASAVEECIMESIEEWGIGDKVYSVTFDDVTDHLEVTECLKNVMHPILDGRVFYARCMCRILISCIQDAWKPMNPIVTKIRCAISYTENRNSNFGDFCEKYGLDPKKIAYDDEYHWDSSRDMMKICMPYKDALNEYITGVWAVVEANKKSYEESHNVSLESSLASDEDDDEKASLESSLISEQEWETVSVFCRILDVFYEAIDDIASTYNPSCSVILVHLVNIAKMFSECRENVAFKQKLSVMEEIFLKHFDRIPELYCVAAVMDPRIKLSGCECLMESFYQCTDGNVKVNVDEQKREVSNLLHEMYGLYVSQSDSHYPSTNTTADFSTNNFAWSLISLKKQKLEESAISELTSYLQRPQESFQQGTEKFDILGWWKAQEIAYPVLATMARDLLATAASSLTPDCAFVLNNEKRILDTTAWNITVGYETLSEFKTLEIYTCLRDWFHAVTRTQGKRKEIKQMVLTSSNFRMFNGPRSYFRVYDALFS